MPERFVQQWIIRTIVGCIISTVVGAISFLAILGIMELLKTPGDFNLVIVICWLIIAVPAYGLYVGYVQWNQQLFNVLPQKTWMLASAMSGVLATIILFLITEYGPAPYSIMINEKRTLYDTWFIAIFIWSVVTGIGFALPFWFVFKRHGYPIKRIFVFSVAGTLTAFTLTMLFDGLGNMHYFTSPYDLCCGTPFFVGGAIGFAVRHILKQKHTIQ
jgi:hypothetical protein